MKKIYYGFCLVFLALAFQVLNVNAQVRYVDVDPGIGTLNTAISGDTAATGERNDPENTVYRLQRGNTAYYGLVGSIENSGFPLTIVAADGDGARPFLQPRDEGSGSSRAFRPRADITLIGLHVTNLDQLGGRNDRMLRCSADGLKVTADNCWFDNSSQSFIRTDNPGQSYFLTNCVISNIGEPGDPNNGRGIDDRGNDIDTIMMENCTWYNVTSRIIRDDGGVIKYASLINCTLNNIGQHGITFGPTEMLVLKNNMSVNSAFVPKDNDSEWYFISVDSVGAVAPVVEMMGNTAYLDTAKLLPYLNDTTTITPFMNATLMAALMRPGAYGPNFNFEINFTDGAPFNDSMLVYLLNPDYDLANAPFWEIPTIPADPDDLYHRDVPYDFGYVHSKAFVAALDGKQQGDRNWTADRDDMVPVDFEGQNEAYFWHQFGNAGDAPENVAVIPNPDKSGINTSDNVFMFTVLDAAETWAGAWSDGNGKMTFTQEKHHMEMMVWKSVISNCGLKVEQGGTVTEVKVPNTVTDQWEVITFDFSANIGETLTRLVFFPDFPEARSAGTVAYVDNIQLITSPVGVKPNQELGLKVYPNPATDQLSVQYKGMTRIVVRDVLGKSVRSMELQQVDHATLSVDDLAEGLYFITVGNEGGNVTTKFLKR